LPIANSQNVLELSFLGATGTVTGSKYLLRRGNLRLLFDCGLFQGYKKLRERNWQVPEVEPASLSSVILSHAHLDHSGYLPRLCQLGFQGPVYATPGTRDLLHVLLPDCGFLQEEEARHAARWNYSRHAPPLPLFTREDAERCLRQIVTVPFGESFSPAPGCEVTFQRAGHIVGSASMAVRAFGQRITFSGDVGRPFDPIMKPAEPLAASDYLVIESTYGDRPHPSEELGGSLARIVSETAQQGGVLLVPAFAVGRAQQVLHLLAELRAAQKIPNLPVFLDSPMAIDATEIYLSHQEEHRLSREQCQAMYRGATFCQTAEDSKAIDARTGPMIVISASGMATGGRILHHLSRFLPDPNNTVLLVGYQAAGTRGRLLADGADELKIHGKYAVVRAKVEQIHGLSAHADYRELIELLRASALSPKRVFVTHGEPGASDAFRRRLHDTFGWDAIVPDDRATYALP
jgi:metallo-beta-lactamase family protein